MLTCSMLFCEKVLKCFHTSHIGTLDVGHEEYTIYVFISTKASVINRMGGVSMTTKSPFSVPLQ